MTSRKTGRWVVPKGWPHKRKIPSDSAAREAREEAGIVGDVHKRPIGTYTYGERMKSGNVVDCEVQVFPLKVKRQQKTWREKGEREIRWFSPTAAARAVKDPLLAKMIRKLVKPR